MSSINDINWLILRFPFGAGGKMLMALLQSSSDVASWNESQLGFEDWFKKCFTADFSAWLDNEPKCPWGLNKIVSATYPRGDNLSDNDFLNMINIHCHPAFHSYLSQKKLMPLVWHKRNVPSYFRNNKMIDIVVDEPSKDIFFKMMINKRFILHSKGNSILVTFLEHRPGYRVGNYENEYIKEFKDKDSFITEIIEPYYQSNRDMSTDYKSSSHILTTLSELCDPEFTTKKLPVIADKLKINLNKDSNMLMRCHHHWLRINELWS